MEPIRAEDSAREERRYAHELDVVVDAIAMVAAGGSRRVTVAGLSYGREVLSEADELASSNQVSLHALLPVASSGLDILVEIPEEAEPLG
jgi:hypothetical protein